MPALCVRMLWQRENRQIYNRLECFHHQVHWKTGLCKTHFHWNTQSSRPFLQTLHPCSVYKHHCRNFCRHGPCLAETTGTDQGYRNNTSNNWDDYGSHCWTFQHVAFPRMLMWLQFVCSRNVPWTKYSWKGCKLLSALCQSLQTKSSSEQYEMDRHFIEIWQNISLRFPLAA